MFKKIKIFVSHRRALVSELIPNSLYYNVICGSALISDHRGLLQDNVGENISEKADYYGEFTVQYWAWKNQKADYYGLCHYRRYLSFSDEAYQEFNEQRFFAEDSIDKISCKKHMLLDVKNMKKEIKKYDIITSVTYDVSSIPCVPKFQTVYDAFVKSPAVFTTADTIERVKKIVKKKFPQYYDTLIKELNSKYHRGFNCFIMKHELFDMMCSFQFGVLFEIEQGLDLKERVGHYQRELGYIGEILYGTFIRWVIDQKKYKVKERHIVLFLDTTKKYAKKNITRQFVRLWRHIKKFFIPNYKKLKDKLSAVHGGLAWQLIEIDKKVNRLTALMEQNKLLTFSVPREFPQDLKKAKLNFWKSFPKATGDLRIIQQANAILLKKFKEICDNQGVSFWVHGGTLIGALRHDGYVPWDDDIDIAMLRKDFLKVKEYLESDKDYIINEYYYFNLGCRSYRFQTRDSNLNCFVDIFIYDDYELRYNDKLTDWQHLCYQKKRIIQELDCYCKDKNVSCPKNNTRLLEYPVLKQLCDKVFEEHISFSKSESENTEYLLWGIDNNYENETRPAWHQGRIFMKEDIFPLKPCEFEEMTLYMPNNYEKYTMTEYGIPYWEMPDNFGQSVHIMEYFEDREQIELLKKFVLKS